MTDGEKVATQQTSGKTGRKGSGDAATVGDALRAVYHDAVGESVPDEMLDLLSKLK